MSNDITELRGHLFDVLRALKEGKMDTGTAQAINDTAQVLVNLAKTELTYVDKVGGKSEFMEGVSAGITRHRLPG